MNARTPGTVTNTGAILDGRGQRVEPIGIGSAFAEKRAELARRVNAAVERFNLEAREHLSLATSVEFRHTGTVVLQQLAMPAGAGVVTLTRGQAEDLMNKIAEQIGLEQVSL
jgi:hypothetical protein